MQSSEMEKTYLKSSEVPGMTKQSSRAKPLLLLGYLGIGVLFIALVVYGSSGGVRGQDQYWYVADVNTLLKDLPPNTNFVFPGTFLRDGLPIEEHYFPHHTITLYIVLIFAKVLSPLFQSSYGAWIVTLTLSSLGTAWLISRIVRGYAGTLSAFFGFAIYLLLPLTFWQTVNPLQESFFALIVALVAYLFLLSQKQTFYWLFFPGTLIIGIMAHPLFFGLGLFVSFAFILLQKDRFSFSFRVVCCLTMLTAFFYVHAMKQSWFPSYFPPTLKNIAVEYGYGSKVWNWSFNLDEPLLTADFMVKKGLESLKDQFSLTRSFVFFWPFNFMVLLFLGMCWHIRRPDLIELKSMGIVLMLLLAAMILIAKNFFRYNLLITPVMLSGALIFICLNEHHRWQRLSKILIMFLIVLGFILIDCKICKHLLNDSSLDKVIVKRIEKELILSKMDLSDRVVMIFDSGEIGDLIKYGTTISPRPFLVVTLENLDDYRGGQLLEKFNPQWVIARENSVDYLIRWGYKLDIKSKNEIEGKNLYKISPG